MKDRGKEAERPSRHSTRNRSSIPMSHRAEDHCMASCDLGLLTGRGDAIKGKWFFYLDLK